MTTPRRARRLWRKAAPRCRRMGHVAALPPEDAGASAAIDDDGGEVGGDDEDGGEGRGASSRWP